MSQVIGFGTRDAAQVTANRIMDYWGRKGYAVVAYPKPVSVRVQNEGDDADTYVGWGVRSDMISGWPRDLYEARCRAALA